MFALILFLSCRLEVIVAGSCSSELLPSNRIHLSYLERVRALSFFFEPKQVKLSELLSVIMNQAFFLYPVQFVWVVSNKVQFVYSHSTQIKSIRANYCQF